MFSTRTWFIPSTHKCHKHLPISIGEVEGGRCREIAGQSAEQASPDASERPRPHTLQAGDSTEAESKYLFSAHPRGGSNHPQL